MDELKGATELLNAYADEFADATIGENTELTSNMQRRLSDAIRVVLAALAKRESVAVPDGITARLRYAVDLLSDYDDEAVQGALATLAGRAIILDIVARRLAASQQAAKGEGT